MEQQEQQHHKNNINNRRTFISAKPWQRVPTTITTSLHRPRSRRTVIKRNVAILSFFLLLSIMMIRLQYTILDSDKTTTTVTTNDKLLSSSWSLKASSSSSSRNATTTTTTTSTTTGFGGDGNPSSFTTPLIGPFCLIHVGKTAGGSISCRLTSSSTRGRRIKLAKSCPSTTSSSTTSSSSSRSSILSQYVLGKFHKATDWGCIRNYNNNYKVRVNQDRKISSSRSTSSTPTSKMKNKNKMEKMVLWWLFSIRNPIDRIISWYEYEHIQKSHSNEIVGNRLLLYQQCYSTMYDLSTIGLQLAYDYNGYSHRDFNTNNNNNTSNNNSSKKERMMYSYTCAKRAYQAITGQVGFQYHNYYNYQYYMNWISHVEDSQHLFHLNSPKKESNHHLVKVGSERSAESITTYNSTNILVLRTEHLEEDWNQLEDMYNEAFGGGSDGGSGDQKSSTSYFERLHQSNSSTAVTGIIFSGDNQGMSTAKVYPNLCRALCNEIKVYLMVIENAINLTPTQKQQSYEELYDKCPMYKTSAKMSSSSNTIQCIDAPIQQYQEEEDEENVKIITNPEYPKMT